MHSRTHSKLYAFYCIFELWFQGKPVGPVLQTGQTGLGASPVLETGQTGLGIRSDRFWC